MFDGKEFCVINGPRGLSKEEIERKIAEVRMCACVEPCPQAEGVWSENTASTCVDVYLHHSALHSSNDHDTSFHEY